MLFNRSFCRPFGFLTALLVLITASQSYGQVPISGTTVIPGSHPETIFDGELCYLTDVDGAFPYFAGSTWVEVVGGDGPGTQSYTSLGGSVPLFMDNGVLMIEGQGLVTFQGGGGASLGLNRRFFAGSNIIGAGVWYDVTESANENVYHQLGYSLELFLGTSWTVRQNGYFPIGEQTNRVSTSEPFGPGVLGFQGNNIVATGFHANATNETAMKGVDVELAGSLGALASEVYLGFYHLQGEVGKKSNGIKGGVRGYITPRLAGDITIANDANFGTRAYGGLTWFFGGSGGNSPGTLGELLTIPVERNRQVAVNETESIIISPEATILTYNDEAITVSHIDANAAGANDGTFENPFQMLPGTQQTDIVYVHADGVYNNQSYELSDGQRFLGEGGGFEHIVMTDQLGDIVLPAGNGGIDVPVIIAPDGQFALVTADNSEISNIHIDNSMQMLGSGIFSESGDVNINNVMIDGGLVGVDLTDTSGSIDFTNVDIADAIDSAFFINGGDSDIAFDNDSSINQSADGFAVLVEGDHSGSLQFDGEIDATSGGGLQFDDANGQYSFDGSVELDQTDAGIVLLSDSDGTFTFADTTINDPTGAALSIDGGSAIVNLNGMSSLTKDNAAAVVDIREHDGVVNLGAETTILSDGASDGLQFSDAGGTYNFAGRVELEDTTAGIVLLDDSDGTFTFDDLTIENPIGTGLSVSGGSSQIAINGTSSITKDNAGSILSVSGGHDGTITFANGSTISATDAVGNDGLQFDNADGTYNFNGDIALDGSDLGLGIVGTSTGMFNFSGISVTDATDTAIHIEGGDADLTFGSTSIFSSSDGGSLVNIGGGHIGSITFDSGATVTAFGPNAGDGLQFDNADGTYQFDGAVTLDGGDAGIDILNGSDGTFTFSETSITDPTGTGLNVSGGTSTVVFDGLSSLIKENAGSLLSIGDGHNGSVTFNQGTMLSATGVATGDGLQFDNADGTYQFDGAVTLDGGDAGIDILNGSDGTFTFSETTITDPSGTGINIEGGSSILTFTGLSNLTKDNLGSTINVDGGHNGTVTFTNGTTISATGPMAGDGLQFDNANGTYNFNGLVTLDGGDAGVDIVNGSSGTFTFSDTNISDPTGIAFNVNDFDGNGSVDFNGNISSTTGTNVVEIDTTASGTSINFSTTSPGTNAISGNGAGGILILDADGFINFNTPVSIVDPNNAVTQTGISILGGSGTVIFGSSAVQLTGDAFNAGVEINGHQGTITFDGLDVMTDGDGVVGLSVFDAENLNFTGANIIDSNGGDGIVMDTVDLLDATFQEITVTNSVAGFGSGSGVTLTRIGTGGAFEVTGNTTVNDAVGMGISIDDSNGTFTFTEIDIDTTTLDGLAIGVLSGNPGNVTISGGSIQNTGGNGILLNGADGFLLNDTSVEFTNGFTVDLTNSDVSGSGNTANQFTVNDGGGNTGAILFNNGANSAP